METKHTPGPWKVSSYGTPHLKVFANDGAHVASVNYGDVDMNTQAANARLIAAAPELLEALSAMVHAYTSTDGNAQCAALAKAEAAFRKAQGKTVTA